jgi:hypothetical protein
MAPPLTGKSLILDRRYVLASHPLARAGWQLFGTSRDPERNNMNKPHLYFRAFLAALLMLAAVPVEAADVKELFGIDLADYPGKEGRMIEVSYPRGARDMIHRHDAHAFAFVYVLQGQIVMQLKGQPAVTLKAGRRSTRVLPMFTSWGATPATRSRPGSSSCC